MAKKLLVVDDEQEIREVLKTFFENNGYEVETAVDGFDFVEKVQGGYKGLVLLDVMMPKLDGWQAVKALVDKELYSNVLICMLTATDSESAISNLLSNYIFSYMSKPFDLDKLSDKVDELNEYYQKIGHE